MFKILLGTLTQGWDQLLYHQSFLEHKIYDVITKWNPDDFWTHRYRIKTLTGLPRYICNKTNTNIQINKF